MDTKGTGKLILSLNFLLLLHLIVGGKVSWKPGTERNKLVAGYGTNFRYLGQLKYNLDRITVVTSIPIPKFADMRFVTIKRGNCSAEAVENPHAPDTVVGLVTEWCAKAATYKKYLEQEEQFLLGKIKNLLEVTCTMHFLN